MIKCLEKTDYPEAIHLLRQVKDSLENHQWTNDYPNDSHVYNDLATHSLFGLFEGDELSAVVTLSAECDGTFAAFDWAEYPKPLFIKRVMTNPAKQNRGFAAKILDFSFLFAKQNGFRTVCIVTEAHNAAMKHLLLKKDFTFFMQQDIQNRAPFGSFLAFSKDIRVPPAFLLKL